MVQHNRFVIQNGLPGCLTLNIEPEGAFFPLGKGEAVSVVEVFKAAPVTIKLTNSDKGDPILSIWPGDGDVRVEKDGVDVFDLIQQGEGGPPRHEEFRPAAEPLERATSHGP
jgi:hypothetical protein